MLLSDQRRLGRLGKPNRRKSKRAIWRSYCCCLVQIPGLELQPGFYACKSQVPKLRIRHGSSQPRLEIKIEQTITARTCTGKETDAMFQKTGVGVKGVFRRPKSKEKGTSSVNVGRSSEEDLLLGKSLALVQT